MIIIRSNPMPQLKPLALLRQKTACPIIKCKEALEINGNDYQKALDWLNNNMAELGAQKLQKVGSRSMNESLLAYKASQGSSLFVKFDCESDFATRSDHMRNFAKDLVNSSVNTKSFENLSEEALLESIKEKYHATMLQCVGLLGENMQITSAKYFPQGYYSHYLHSSSDNITGYKLSVCKFSKEIDAKAGNQIAQHVLGFNPSSIDELLDQQYLFDESITVRNFLESHSTEIIDFHVFIAK